MQINGLEVVTSQSTQGSQYVYTLQFYSTRSIDAAATDVQTSDLASDRQSACGSSLATDLLQDESERSADHVPRDGQRLGHAGSTLRLRSTNVGQRLSILPACRR
jgi:hypothetical protein